MPPEPTSTSAPTEQTSTPAQAPIVGTSNAAQNNPIIPPSFSSSTPAPATPVPATSAPATSQWAFGIDPSTVTSTAGQQFLQAATYYGKNQDSPYYAKFMQSLNSGAYNAQATAAGIDITKYPGLFQKQNQTPVQTQEANATENDNEIFGNTPASGIINSILKTTIGSQGLGGLVAKPIVAALTAGAEKGDADSKTQLASVTQDIIKQLGTMNPSDPNYSSLMGIVQENQKSMGISDDTMNQLQSAQETQEQNVGGALNSAATLASFATAGATNPSLVSKILTSAGVGAGFGGGAAAANNGSAGQVAEGLGVGALTGTATEGLLAGGGKAADWATSKLPENILNTKLGGGFTLKQVLSHQNDKAVQAILENGKVGTVKGLAAGADSTVSDLNNQVNEALASHSGDGTTISMADAAQQTSDRLNQQGWTTTPEDVLNATKTMVGKQAGSAGLAAGSTDLAGANAVRQGIDSATRPSAWTAAQTPENTTMAMEMADTLRGIVKGGAPETSPMFDSMSKNITLRNALETIAAKGEKAGIKLSPGDLVGIVSGLGSGIVGGGNVGLDALYGVGADAAYRGATSMPGSTAAAIGLNKLGAALPYLSKLTPAVRFYLLNQLGGASGNAVSSPSSGS